MHFSRGRLPSGRSSRRARKSSVYQPEQLADQSTARLSRTRASGADQGIRPTLGGLVALVLLDFAASKRRTDQA